MAVVCGEDVGCGVVLLGAVKGWEGKFDPARRRLFGFKRLLLVERRRLEALCGVVVVGDFPCGEILCFRGAGDVVWSEPIGMVEDLGYVWGKCITD